MKTYLAIITLICLFCLRVTVSAQCPTGISANSQEDIDNFALNYPKCTHIPGPVSITNYSNSPITSLAGLGNIDSIDGGVQIVGFNSLSGLENLRYIGGFLAITSADLTDFQGLNNLSSIGNYLSIDCDSLVNLSGLENLKSVGSNFNINWDYNNMKNFEGLESLDSIGGSLYIPSLSAFNSFQGLESLSYIGRDLHVFGNDNFTNFLGLENLNTIGEDLYIGLNSKVVDLSGLESLNFVGGDLRIYDNSIVSLSGLQNLNILEGSVLIYDNSNLTDISGIENIDYTSITELSISDNSELSLCGVESICEYLVNGGTATIENNAEGCNTVEEIIESCSFVWEYAVEGNIFMDANDDCLRDASELSLNDWIVKVENDQSTRYAYTYNNGKYVTPVDTGTYIVTAIPPNSLWEDVCFENNIAVLTPSSTRDTLDFGASTSTFCPLLEVDVTAPFVRRCFDSNYYVNYCNSGTATAENAYIEVQLDPFFTYQNSTIAGTDLGENLYSFDLGNIDIGDCGSFRIDVYIDCDSTELGQTHCVEAHIYPDSICTPALPLWDGASIEVNAQCLGDSIEFKIKNVGTGDMSDSLEYIIIQDDLIYQRMNFHLNSDSDITFYKETNGEFHRLESEQSPGHPGYSMPSVFVEGCGVNDDGEISMGFVNYYLLDEADAFVSIDCQENIGSYDPNDKQAFPIGHGPLHFITDSTDLEYLIRFQNTGTDTAFTVVIRDTISPHLNIETLRPGVASHDYRYDIEESNIAVFHFENIMLPDSNVNEAASHGFIKFNIKQQPDNELRDIIENNAAIYFDFNEPIITNTVFHTVNADFLSLITSVVTPPEVVEAGISVHVFPNPFDKYTTFEIEGQRSNELHLNLYDMMGREVLQQHTIHQQHIKLYKNNLPSGIYVFKLTDEKQALATGKLVIE